MQTPMREAVQSSSVCTFGSPLLADFRPVLQPARFQKHASNKGEGKENQRGASS